jgi:hypothetical protein
MTAVLEPTLSYSSSIPRAHVHRAAICEVFLTDIICESYPQFRLGVQLPRVHSYYSDHNIDLDSVRVGPAPAAGVLDATITAEKRRGADIVGITLAMTLALDGSAAAPP